MIEDIAYKKQSLQLKKTAFMSSSCNETISKYNERLWSKYMLAFLKIIKGSGIYIKSYQIIHTYIAIALAVN